MYKLYLNGGLYGKGSLDYIPSCELYNKEEVEFKIIKSDL
ncbi:hypothetical protein Bmyc01_18620 [Bacillus mycoides]|nr:hypothetical protein Bmyc01_18620 [Bacillus mycoides]